MFDLGDSGGGDVARFKDQMVGDAGGGLPIRAAAANRVST
jgi:hypothetical protein